MQLWAEMGVLDDGELLKKDLGKKKNMKIFVF